MSQKLEAQGGISGFQLDNLDSQLEKFFLQLEKLNSQPGKSDLQPENPRCLPCNGSQDNGGIVNGL